MKTPPFSLVTDRRTILSGLATFSALAGGSLPAVGEAETAQDATLQWVVTTQYEPWRMMTGARVESFAAPDANITLAAPAQTIEGFGACFNELGWDALSRLSAREREGIMAELFGPDGARFSLCRMPVGANDFSRDWYSYDETPGDFALRDFSIDRDRTTLLPFIKAALAQQPALRLWASPWSPPTWMKRNGHYASTPNRPGWPANGLRADQLGREGEDMFILEPRYLDAYARYFGRFIDAYAAQGIRIGMVMPQNEFNSAQPFPSCCWTPDGLSQFLPHLGREMGRRGVDVFFGTMERADDHLFESVMAHPEAAAVIKGVGVQWAGKGAVAAIHAGHPALPIYQSEQECGDGRNDWRYCRYTWSLMKHYFRNGASGYDYWNIALDKGGISRWGWAQNSLITVDAKSSAWRWNHEYWLMKHLSHFVRRNAIRIETISWTGYEDMLAFRNPDGSTVMVVQNPLAEQMPLTVAVDGRQIAVNLPADSFSTIILAPV